MKKLYRKVINVPIYNVDVIIVIVDDHEMSGHVKKLDKEYGCWEVLFQYDSIDYNLMSHEIFHLTHRIMEYVGINFRSSNHEPFAYLNGWLSQKIMTNVINHMTNDEINN